MKTFVWISTGLMLIGLLSFSSISLAEEGKWTKKSDMPTKRSGLSTSVVDGKIYAIGGSGVTSIVEEYDLATDTWTKKADMPTARWGLSTSVVNGKIYAIGGAIRLDGGAVLRQLSTVEEYNPVTDTWTKKADMPTARWGLSTSAVNGKIYAIGGFGNAGSSSRVEEYDPKTNTWTKTADMPTARQVLSTSTVNGKIYAIGGFIVGPLSTVEVYDPVTDNWMKGADMPTARSNLSTSVVNGKIYAIGGYVGAGRPVLSTMEEYDTGFEGGDEEGIEAKGKLATSWGKMKK